MKVFIGDYKNWSTSYDLYCWLSERGISEDLADKISDFVDKYTPIFKITKFIYDIRSKWGVQNTYIKIDSWDTWSGDHTLGRIILPFLKEFKVSMNGYPNEFNNEEEWDTILDKMIWSFEQVVNDEWEWKFYEEFDNLNDDESLWVRDENGNLLYKKIRGKWDIEGHDAYDAKIQEGLELFGKHFRNFWN